jgi:uncharacterized protein YkwD
MKNRALSFAWVAALLAACGPGAAEPADEPVAGDEAIDDGASGDGASGDGANGDGAEESAPAQTVADPMARAIVAAHDARRAEHCAAPIAYSTELAQVAQAWASSIASHGCALQHSSGPYGENLAAGTAGTLSPEQVVEMWYSESARYRYRNARFSMQTGHFTQVVWAGTARVGCGTTTCNGMDVFVCNYDPPGNIEGEFEENVHPTSCR